jgi:hypothetical protein
MARRAREGELGATLTRIGMDTANRRTLALLRAREAADLPAHLDVGSPYFVALLAWDAAEVTTDDIAHVAKRLLDAGCVYFCCWGVGCERVHDIVDDVYLRGGLSVHDDGSTIMTTWHSEESLEEALWFTRHAAFADDRYFDDCGAVVAICIGDPEWGPALESALRESSGAGSRATGEDV